MTMDTDGKIGDGAPAPRIAALPATMRAWVQEGRGSADVLQLREIALPAVAPDRVLVKVRAASVNALDYHTIHGGLLLDIVSKLMRSKPDPYRGVDVSGVVVAAGADVAGLRPGDEVFGVAAGTFAEYALGSARGLVTKPKDMTFAQAAAVGVAAFTGLQAVRDHAHLAAGQRVLIFGAGGGVGTYAVQFAKALGAHVTAVTGPRNIDLVAGLGADEVIDYSKEDVTKRPASYDAVVDVAAIRPIGALRRALLPGGIYVLVGASKSGGWLGIFGRIAALIVRSKVLKQRALMFIAKTGQADLLYMRELIEAGKVRPQIDRVFPFEQTQEAVRYAETGQARAKARTSCSSVPRSRYAAAM
ncbi:MAG TPA: NAD(P)-dependent alcohol dehydrogenase [Candidatus Acidoferrales bacterium]|nr:NAD(P)-dependent alcohol dehydrogenase [Candidatus Acidoferrales bacterium]